MSTGRLIVLAAAALLAAVPAASATPVLPEAPTLYAGRTAALEAYHSPFGSPRHHWSDYDQYQRYRGFSLRLGWGYPSYGYPWASRPYYGVVRPRVVMPAPVTPAIPYGVPPAWTAQWYAYCREKYRSFDSRSGLYTTYSGQKRMCR